MFGTLFICTANFEVEVVFHKVIRLPILWFAYSLMCMGYSKVNLYVLVRCRGIERARETGTYQFVSSVGTVPNCLSQRRGRSLPQLTAHPKYVSENGLILQGSIVVEKHSAEVCGHVDAHGCLTSEPFGSYVS